MDLVGVVTVVAEAVFCLPRQDFHLDEPLAEQGVRQHLREAAREEDEAEHALNGLISVCTTMARMEKICDCFNCNVEKEDALGNAFFCSV